MLRICQVAPADTQAKTWQRVCLPHSTTDRQSTRKTEGQQLTAVWRNGGCSASYDSFVDQQTVVLRIKICGENPPLRQATKRFKKLLRLGMIIPGFHSPCIEHPSSFFQFADITSG